MTAIPTHARDRISPGWLFDALFFTSALASAFFNDLVPGHGAAVSKLVPMGLLLGHLIHRLRAAEVDRRMGARLLAGLLASAAGDVIIAYVFVGGIGAFLIAHIAYLAAMGRPRGRVLSHLLASLPALAVGGTMAWILVAGRRVPEPLLVPVIVYMAVVSAMLARATGRGLVDARTRESHVLLAGAAMFVGSDALIALSRWVVEIPHGRLAIMSTYFVAQRLLVAGVERSRQSAAGESGAPLEEEHP